MICKLTSICENKCDKFCQYIVGDNLVRFLREIDTLPSQVGERTGDYIISGAQIDATGNIVNILSDVSESINITQKFRSTLEKSAMAILTAYLKMTNAADADELRSKLTKIDNNKLLMLPIKPGMTCEVAVEASSKDGAKKESFKSSKVETIKWFNSKLTKEFECVIFTEVIDTNGNKRAKISLEEYGEKIKLTDIERTFAEAEIDRSLVKMTRHGIIRPLCVTDVRNTGIIIDNTYMYKIEHGTITLLASWVNGELVGKEKEFIEIQKTPQYKRIKKHIKFISQHRRFIAPYGLVDTNNIKV